ncbi:MAG TPA: glycosyltransferase [Phycisphaerae bacterium]|nr:glycosyltransferase [Phycisphaerae bacterium]
MRVLIVDCAYPGFLADLYNRHPEVEALDFEQHRLRYMDEGFGTADAMSHHLNRLGHQAQEIVVNAFPMQRAWAREHGVQPDPHAPHWQPPILTEQIRTIHPDVLYVQELGPVPDEFWAGVKPLVRLLVGQVACTIPKRRSFAAYDLVVSSWPPLVDHFRQHGRSAEHLPLCFDPRVLDRLGHVTPQRDVTFVGGLGAVHPQRTRLIERLCSNVDLDLWGYLSGSDPLPEVIQARHHGEAWGLQMYRILAGSRITINHHLVHEVGGRRDHHVANNCRLYEATGVGTLLITDQKDNLPELFAPGCEVVTYRDPDDCIEQVRRFLEDEPARQAIAAAGQQRTLREHSFARRMAELADRLRSHLP